MTAALIVSMNGRQTAKTVIQKDHFVIGRSRRSDLLLDDKNVSREHAIIVTKDGALTIQDRGSRNGTLVNGQSIPAATALHDGDTIGIGPFELKFFEGGGAPAPAPAMPEEAESKTHFFDAAKAKQDARKSGPARRKETGASTLQYKLVATEGPLKGTHFDNWEGILSLGRAPDNKVVLPDDAVSHAHAKIWEEDGVFSLEDLGSSNGTFLDGVRVKQAKMKSGQRVRIGASTFLFTAIDPEKRKFKLVLTAVTSLFVIVLILVVGLIKPEDPLAVFIAQGNEYLKKGEYEQAKQDFEKALQARPSDPDAIRGLSTAKQGIEREAVLNEARMAADEEQYDAALETCYQLLRQYPNYKKARELEQVITTVKNAQVAFEGKNWPDAIEFLKKARKDYPTSALLSRMLDRAQSELAAKQNLAKATDFYAHNQSDNAQELLLGIPESSAYYVEARGMLQKIKSADAMSGTIADVRRAYRDGNLEKAYTMIADGLAQQPDNAQLQGLKKNLDAIAPLARYVQGGQALVQSEDPQVIQDMIDACKRLTDAETDSQNKLRTDAITLSSSLRARLGDIERTAVANGETMLARNNKSAAYKHFSDALKANPGNQRAATVVEEIRAEVTADCKKYFQQGLVHEELNQRDLAIAAFEKVVATGLEGDSYYERAKTKLQTLKR